MTPLTNLKPLADRGIGIARGAASLAGSQGRALLERAQNLRSQPKPEMTDETLKAKVESVVFRQAGVTKDKINVTVVDRKVTLHGEAKNPAMITALQAAVVAIPEVAGVENMLALRKSTARKKPATPAKPRTTGQRFNREVKATKGEPSPKELAAAGKGRAPAPLGSTDGDTATTGSGSGSGSEGDGTATATKVEASITSGTASRGSGTTGDDAGTTTATEAAKTATKNA